MLIIMIQILQILRNYAYFCVLKSRYFIKIDQWNRCNQVQLTTQTWDNKSPALPTSEIHYIFMQPKQQLVSSSLKYGKYYAFLKRIQIIS